MSKLNTLPIDLLKGNFMSALNQHILWKYVDILIAEMSNDIRIDNNNALRAYS